jgi:hypothetical protein
MDAAHRGRALVATLGVLWAATPAAATPARPVEIVVDASDATRKRRGWP